MTITPRSSLTHVSFAVCTALHKIGTTAVLTGGSAAAYYAPDRYQSRDADFVITMSSNPNAASSAYAILDSLRREEFIGIRLPSTPWSFRPAHLRLEASSFSITSWCGVARRH